MSKVLMLCLAVAIIGMAFGDKLHDSISTHLKDVLGTVNTNENGHFSISGDTANYQGFEANIDPYIKIYHKCDDTEGQKGHRRVTLRFPRDFVSLGRISRKTYNVGQLNLQIEYPSETRVNTIEGLKV